MTLKQAKKAARERWGKKALIDKRKMGGEMRCLVGYFMLFAFSVEGTGDTWEDAFAKADEKWRKHGGPRTAKWKTAAQKDNEA